MDRLAGSFLLRSPPLLRRGSGQTKMTRAQQVGVIIGLSIVAALTILRASDPQLLKLAREATFDEYQRLAPRHVRERCPSDRRHRRSLAAENSASGRGREIALPRWSTGSRTMGASAIAFDILFAEPDRLSPRTVVRDVPGIDPSLLQPSCPTMTRFSPQCDCREARSCSALACPTRGIIGRR